MKNLNIFKAYIQGDIEEGLQNLISSYMFSEGQSISKPVTDRKDIPSFRVKDKVFTNIRKHKYEYNYHIFILTPMLLNHSIIADIIDSCYTNPKGTIILINTRKENTVFNRDVLKELYDVIDLANSITNREIGILNYCYGVLDFIEENTIKEINLESETTLINSVNSIYSELNKTLPSEVFLNQSKIDNIKRVVFKYITEKIKPINGTN